MIVGLWRAVDPTASYWDVKDESLLLVHEDKGIISDRVGDELRNATWMIIADGSSLTQMTSPHAGADPNDRESCRGASPETALIAPPLEAWRAIRTTPRLTYLLFAFSVPILSLILAFIGLVAGLFVNEQRGEMAILRSRGASTLQVVGISLLQGVLLGAIALAGGVGLAAPDHTLHRQSAQFSGLQCDRWTARQHDATGARVWSAGNRHHSDHSGFDTHVERRGNTIVTYKQERARSFRTTWWQRYWLDILLLIPAGYGLWRSPSSLNEHWKERRNPDPLQNPPLLLVPALGIFSVALFTLRLVPRLMDLISRVLKPSKSIGMLMAARYWRPPPSTAHPSFSWY